VTRTRSVVAIILLLIAIVAVVLVLLPAPDPLRNAETVYLDTGRAQGSNAAVELEDGLGFVLNDRNLLLVPDRSQADAEIRIREISVNLGDVTLTLADGGVTGHVTAVCGVTDLRTNKTYTMDLTVTVNGDEISAQLVGRKFWEFWK